MNKYRLYLQQRSDLLVGLWCLFLAVGMSVNFTFNSGPFLLSPMGTAICIIVDALLGMLFVTRFERGLPWMKKPNLWD